MTCYLPEVKRSDAADATMSSPCRSEWIVVKCMIETLSIMAITGGTSEDVSLDLKGRLSSHLAYCHPDITPQMDNITALCETLWGCTNSETFVDVIMLLQCYMRNGAAAISLCHFSDFENECTTNIYFVLSELRLIFNKLKPKREVPVLTEYPLPCVMYMYPFPFM